MANPNGRSWIGYETIEAMASGGKVLCWSFLIWVVIEDDLLQQSA